jgi:hypothetical protein
MILDQIQNHNARAITNLNDIHAAQITLIEYLAILAQTICGRLKIKGNFCGIGNTESRGRCR